MTKKNKIEDYIVIKRAREHNLKNISVDIPKEKFVVITGLSGSGKSSLAFDVIYAEGQRRYVESLSTYARKFLDQFTKPAVDSIEGLSPAISIEQRGVNKNPRSTVGTITEIYDYMRLLFAKIAIPYSPVTGKKLSSQSPEKILERIMALKENTKIQILAPIVLEKKGEHRKEIAFAQSAGYTRAKIDGKTINLDEDTYLDKNKKHNISIIIDRITIKKNIERRLAQSIKSTLKQTSGLLTVELLDSGEEIKFNTRFYCPESGMSFPKPEPRLFSFNSPVGACEKCNGLGYRTRFDPDLIIQDKTKSILGGALEAWSGKSASQLTPQMQILETLSHHYSFDLKMPYYRLSDKIKTMLFFGSGKDEIQFKIKGRTSTYRSLQKFEGVINEFKRKYKNANSIEESFYEKFLSKMSCSSCKGARLKPETLAFKINKKSIAEINLMPVDSLKEFISSITLSEKEKKISSDMVKEISARLVFLSSVGLNYLSLSRPAATLSGGEIQRVHLATQIGSSITGVLYVLDEPSIGLHQRDNNLLLNSLNTLKSRGNSVIVVEHDRETIEAADFIIDMGPGSGINGGNIMFVGTPKQLEKCKKSVTGAYLRGSKKITHAKKKRKSNTKISLIGCQQNNLKNISIDIPLEQLICFTGVSGSGKSSLVIQTLVPAIKNLVYRRKHRSTSLERITGLENIDKIINVDQSPIGRSPRSNPATYSGLLTHIRNLLAKTKEASIRGYKQGRFSFNVKGGRCETCEGAGHIKAEMHFLPDIFIPCHICNTARFNRETLTVRYKGKNIANILDMTIEEALKFFSTIPAIEKYLKILSDIGLGYIKLGQSATTLSGGEAQRMKLAKELSKRPTGKTIYVLDEPSTGLHFADIETLLKVLHRLVDRKNTVIIIEHNLDIIKHADYIIDMGPEGGNLGGEIVAQGTPKEIIKSKKSYTAKYLKEYL